MTTFKKWISTGLLCGCALALGATNTTVPADNTKVNERDRSVTEKTAEQQGSSDRDVTLTQKIRQELTRDDSLSTYAKNVKIITENGRVTLKGPVRSEEEKNKVVAKATSVAGAGAVAVELQVAP